MAVRESASIDAAVASKEIGILLETRAGEARIDAFALAMRLLDAIASGRNMT